MSLDEDQIAKVYTFLVDVTEVCNVILFLFLLFILFRKILFGNQFVCCVLFFSSALEKTDGRTNKTELDTSEKTFPPRHSYLS